MLTTNFTVWNDLFMLFKISWYEFVSLSKNWIALLQENLYQVIKFKTFQHILANVLNLPNFDVCKYFEWRIVSVRVILKLEYEINLQPLGQHHNI